MTKVNIVIAYRRLYGALFAMSTGAWIPNG
jgi:hypothetical protein